MSDNPNTQYVRMNSGKEDSFTSAVPFLFKDTGKSRRYFSGVLAV